MISDLLKTVLRRERVAADRPRPTGSGRPARLVKADRAAMPAPVGARNGRTYTRGCLLVFLAALVYAGWVETMSQMQGAQRFALVALEVRGIRMLDGDEVLKASGLSVGDNIFAVDLDSVAVRLAKSLVWVRSVRVERKPPDRLVMWIDERRRHAWVEIDDRMFGVDEDGVLLPEQALSSETSADLDLPVIKDLQLEEWKRTKADVAQTITAGEAVADSTLGAILGWWGLARQRDVGFSSQISELRPFGKDALSVILAGDDLEIRLPIQGQDLGEQLHVLTTVLPTVYRDIANPVYVDLRFVNQLVVGTLHQQSNTRQVQDAPVVRDAPAVRGEQSVGPTQAVSASARGDHRG